MPIGEFRQRIQIDVGNRIFSHAPTAAYERSGPETEGSPEAIIEFICRPCDRHCALERKLLVKAFGASMPFAVIRRRMAMGCERMQTPEGDKCGAHFPCLGDTDCPDGSQAMTNDEGSERQRKIVHVDMDAF